MCVCPSSSCLPPVVRWCVVMRLMARLQRLTTSPVRRTLVQHQGGRGDHHRGRGITSPLPSPPHPRGTVQGRWTGPHQLHQRPLRHTHSTIFIDAEAGVYIEGILLMLSSKANYNHSCTHPQTAGRVSQVSQPESGAVRVRRLAQGHLDTQLGRAGDRTSNHLITSQPALSYCHPCFGSDTQA